MWLYLTQKTNLFDGKQKKMLHVALHDHEKTLIITNEVKDLTDVPPAVGGVDGAVNVVLFPLIL
jgi:hypothetical protein